jgi:hypothetical protein
MRLRFVFLFLVAFLLTISAAFSQREDFANASFRMADSIAQLYPGYPLRDIRGLARKLTESLPSDVEKFRAIYLWTCLNVENDYYLFRENQLKRARLKDAEQIRKWNKEFFPRVMETLLKKQKTVCTGYAYLIRELALHAGLSCVMIDGYGRTSQANVGGDDTPNHSWNAVRLNNKWYLCDATWSSGAIDMGKREFSKDYNDTYFLLEPKLFISNHYPMDSSWALSKERPTLLEFLQKPLVYDGALRYNFDHFEPKTFRINAERAKPIVFSFRNNDHQTIDKIELQVHANGTTSVVRKDFWQKDDSSVHVEHIFTSKGRLVVHMLVNGAFVSSYSIEVD